ncbi:MAG: hypothetical protein DWQ02_03415 [Bacteroidetes bacterium]|nr:MAG: hypothetical protein DWQ02_03415 [Bacteroidota bacterium]
MKGPLCKKCGRSKVQVKYFHNPFKESKSGWYSERNFGKVENGHNTLCHSSIFPVFLNQDGKKPKTGVYKHITFQAYFIARNLPNPGYNSPPNTPE